MNLTARILRWQLSGPDLLQTIRCGPRPLMGLPAPGLEETRRERARGYRRAAFPLSSRNESSGILNDDSSSGTVSEVVIRKSRRSPRFFYSTLMPMFTSQSVTAFLNSLTAAGVTLVCQR